MKRTFYFALHSNLKRMHYRKPKCTRNGSLCL